MPDRRFAAIVSIDTVGYSRLMETDASGLIHALNVIVRKLAQPLIVQNGGRLVKLIGDAALVEFPSAGGAISFSVALQDAMQGPKLPYTFVERIRVRIGIHAGDVITSDEDIFGDAVNIAARLQAMAQPDGVLISRLVADLSGTDFSVRFKPQGVHRIKNIERPIEVLSVDMVNHGKADARDQMIATQEVQFCRAPDGVMLAWTSNGTGPVVVKAPNWIGHLEHDVLLSNLMPILQSVCSQNRLIRFDARGNGLSDWDVDEISFERFVDDLECVFDAAGIDRAPILSFSQGAAVAAAFAHRAPERVSGIVMIGSFPIGRAIRKSAKDRERAAALKAMMQAGWDDEYPSLRDLIAEIIAPGFSIEDRRAYAEAMRLMISPENMGRYRDVIDHIDITDLLPKIETPCLVLHNRGDRMQPVEQGRKMAAGLPNGRFIAYDSNNHLPLDNEPIWPKVKRDILDFLAHHT